MGLSDIRFYGTWRGNKIYRVLRAGSPLFTGTKGECHRYIGLHEEKARRELKSLASPRRRKIFVKRYRVSSRTAASF